VGSCERLRTAPVSFQPIPGHIPLSPGHSSLRPRSLALARSPQRPQRRPIQIKGLRADESSGWIAHPIHGVRPCGADSSSKFAPGEFVQHRVAKETLRLRFVGSYRALPAYGNAEVRAWMVARTRNTLSGQCPDAYNKGIQDQSGGSP
jgi:hypothetical protein